MYSTVLPINKLLAKVHISTVPLNKYNIFILSCLTKSCPLFMSTFMPKWYTIFFYFLKAMSRHSSHVLLAIAAFFITPLRLYYLLYTMQELNFRSSSVFFLGISTSKMLVRKLLCLNLALLLPFFISHLFIYLFLKSAHFFLCLSNLFSTFFSTP